MRRVLKLLVASMLLLLMMVGVMTSPAQAQQPEINQTYQVGTVTQILNEQVIPVDGQDYYIQEVEVQTDDGTKTVLVGNEFQPINANQRLKVGSRVITSQQPITPEESQLVISDVYRLPVLWMLVILFGILVIVVAGKQGTLSIVGMILSLGVLINFIVPEILAGKNPVFITLLGAIVTATVTMYLSHGFKRQTHIALASMVLCLLAVAILATTAVNLGQLVGLGSEEAAFLQFGQTQRVDLQGLLLAGIMLGALGILDDITLAQTSVIEQLKAVHPKISFAELYNRGLAVGRDHVASLVNTLIFAYAGTSLPLFLLFTLYRTQPAWVVINSEVIAEEVIRTLVGSIGLVMAVPITTLIACYYVTKLKPDLKIEKSKTAHAH